MTTPPLDLPALQAELKATRRVAKQHMNRAETAESACKTLAEVLAKHSEWIIEATDSQSVISEDGDGDWDVVWDRVMELGNKARQATARAEAAEKKLAAGLAVITEYGEQQHSDECGSGDCCRCTLDDFRTALDGTA